MRLRALFPVLLLGFVLTSANGQNLDSSAQSDELAERLPADTLMYLSFPNLTETAEQYRKMPVAKILAEEEVQTFIEPMIALWKQMESDAARGLGVDAAQLSAIRPKSIRFALTHLRMPPSRVDDIGVVLELEVQEGRDQLGAFLESLIGNIKTAETNLVEEHLTIGTKTVHFLGERSEGGVYWYDSGPNRMTWTTDRALLDRLLGSGEKPASLASNEDYRLAMSRVAEPGDELRTFVNAGRMARVAGGICSAILSETELRDYSSRVMPVLEALGVLDLGGIGSKSIYVGSATQMATFMRHPSRPRGVMSFTVAQPVSLDRLELIPKEATAFTLARVDFRQAMPMIREIVGAIDPTWREIFEGYLSTYQERLELDIQADFLDQLGGEALFYNAPPRGPLPLPSMIFMIGCRDPQRFHGALMKLLSLSEGQVSVREVPFDGKTLQAFSFDGIPLPFQPSYAFHEGFLIGAFDIQDLKSTLRRFSSPGSSILERQDFLEAIAQQPIPDNVIAVNYSDTAAALESGYQTIQQLAAMPGFADELPIPLDLALLPTSRAFTKHLFGSVTYTVAEKDGLYSHGYSPIGPEVYAAMGGLFGLGSVLWVSKSSEGFSIPEPAPSRTQPADDARTMAVRDIEQLTIAVTFYKIEHDGQLPKELSDLLRPTETYPEGVYSGKTLPNDPWGRRYVYRVDGNRFVIYSLGENGRDENGDGDDVRIRTR
ncbi:MAG: type II secretion system protein GspG [Planctomycetota bacterium]